MEFRIFVLYQLIKQLSLKLIKIVIPANMKPISTNKSTILKQIKIRLKNFV